MSCVRYRHRSAGSQVLVAAMLVGLLGQLAAGCQWGRSPKAWAEETSQLSLDATGISRLEVRTHNGAIQHTGVASGSGATVVVKKRGGGKSEAEAQEALAAIEIVSERGSEATQKLGWRWKVERKRNWAAEVEFTIEAPAGLEVDAETHNGAVTVTNVSGDVKVATHNGAVKVESRGSKLSAQTHNGAMTTTFAGSEIRLETHNGEIKADLTGSASVGGKIETHNGAIELNLGSSTATDITAETDNGRVSHEGAVNVKSAARTRLEGSVGAGGKPLHLETNNGGITIKAGG